MEGYKTNFHRAVLLQCKVCTLLAVMARGKEHISSWSWFHTIGIGHLEYSLRKSCFLVRNARIR